MEIVRRDLAKIPSQSTLRNAERAVWRVWDEQVARMARSNPGSFSETPIPAHRTIARPIGKIRVPDSRHLRAAIPTEHEDDPAAPPSPQFQTGVRLSPTPTPRANL